MSIFRFGIVAGMSVTLLMGCAGRELVRGYVFDLQAVSELREGVDDRLSVVSSLGNPSAVSSYQDSTWYYLNQVTRQRAFFNETVVGRSVLQVNFDEEGYLVGTARYTLKDGNPVTPLSDKTPTRGKTENFFQQIFSNIGQFGAGGPGGVGGPGR